MEKKKKIILVISIVLSVALFAGGIYGTYRYQQNKIDELNLLYKTQIDEYQNRIQNLSQLKNKYRLEIDEINKSLKILGEDILIKNIYIEEAKNDLRIKQDQIDALVKDIEKLEEEKAVLEIRLKRYIQNTNTPTGGKRVYLTFDDGPSNLTPRVLDVLDDYNVKATFFVIGANAKGYPHIVRRTYAEGHMVLPHSYTHNYNIYTTFDTFYDDLEKTKGTLESILGIPMPKLFRFPGGSSNKVSYQYGGQNFMSELTKDVISKGYYYIDWNVSSEDAGGSYNNAQRMLQKTIKWTSNKNIAVALYHDTGSNYGLVEALPEIIEFYIINGYEFCTFENISQSELDAMEAIRVVNMPIQ